MTNGYGDPLGGTIGQAAAADAGGATHSANLDAAHQEIAALHRALHEAEQKLVLADLRERALSDELQHRVRNMLAVVRSVFSRTADAYEAGTDIADHFKGRLEALARSQTWTVRSPEPALELEALIWDELLAAAAANDSRITVRGPAVYLTGKAAESMCLAIHELVTNSIKFGILSQEHGKGHLLVEWDVAARNMNFAWQESGVTIMSAAPLRSGFGRDFIENSLPYQADADTSFVIEPGVISCRISLPLFVEKVAPNAFHSVNGV